MYAIWHLCYVADVAVTEDEFDPDTGFELDASHWLLENLKHKLSVYNKSELSDIFGAAVFLQQLQSWSNQAASSLMFLPTLPIDVGASFEPKITFG